MLAKIDYVNWRGERATREIFPLRIEWCSNEWHPTPQWLLVAVDTQKAEIRSFAMSGIRGWS